MSHNVQITGIKINNLDVLESALAELRKEGIGATLELGIPGARALTFRTYMHGSNSTKADHVIRLSQCKYDIGLVQQPGGHYEPIYDNSLGLSVACPIACEYKPGNQFNFRMIRDKAELELASKGIAIGKLMQRYTAIITENDARRKGFLAQRIMAENGDLQIVIRTR